MKKTYTIAITLLAILLLLALAVFRGQGSRELILKRNGLPLANLKADVLSNSAGTPTVLRTSTDLNGRLDLSTVPEGTQMIAITLWEGTGSAFNGDIFLPTRGSRTIDFRGNRSICTTKRTYADFGLFKLTGQEVVEYNRTVAPLEAEAEQPRPVDRAQPAASRPSAPGN
jgi:hypothetical protein